MSGTGPPSSPGGDGPAPVPASRGPFRLAAFVLAVTAFGAGVPTPLYGVYQQRFHFDATVLAAIFGSYTVGVLATMLLVAPLSDLIGRKPVLYLGMLLTGLSGVVFIVAHGVADLALARVVSGLAVGATTSTATAAMAGLEPRRDQHHVARVSVAANFGAVGSGVLLCGVLIVYAPWPELVVYLVLIGVSVAGALAVRALPETVPSRPSGSRLRSERVRVPATIRLPFWVAAGSLAACYSIYGFFGALAPTAIREALSISNRASSAAIVASLFGLAALVQLGLGQVRDRRALVAGLPILLAGLVGLMLSLPLHSVLVLVGAALTLGVGVGFVYMGSVTLIDRVAPTAMRGEVLSAFFVVGYLALAVPTVGVGLASVQLGFKAAGALFGAALGLFAAVLFIATRATPTPPGGEGRPRGVS